jgi:hypothetical protein
MAMVMRDLDLDPKRYTRARSPPGVQPQERAHRRGDLTRAGRTEAGRLRGDHHERMLAEAYCRLPAAAAPGQRARLRRPHHDDGQHPAGLPRRGRALSAALPARAGRRVPGHQPRAIQSWSASSSAAREPPRRAPRMPSRPASSSSSATPTSRSTPSGGRRSATSSSSSRTTPTRAPSCWSRTTARRRPSCAPPTRSSPAIPTGARRTCGPRRATAPHRRLCRRQRARRGVLRRATHRRLGDEHGVKPKDVAVFYRTNAQSRAVEEVFVRVGCPTRSSAAPGSTSARRSRTPSPTCG